MRKQYADYNPIATTYYECMNSEIGVHIDLEVPSFKKLISYLTNESVIDFACGTGYYTKILREQTSGQIYGIDISVGMLEHA
jgi:ubiquinone/menaquinone biosynthesis C-methylase UbiE